MIEPFSFVLLQKAFPVNLGRLQQGAWSRIRDAARFRRSDFHHGDAAGQNHRTGEGGRGRVGECDGILPVQGQTGVACLLRGRRRVQCGDD